MSLSCDFSLKVVERKNFKKDIQQYRLILVLRGIIIKIFFIFFFILSWIQIVHVSLIWVLVTFLLCLLSLGYFCVCSAGFFPRPNISWVCRRIFNRISSTVWRSNEVVFVSWSTHVGADRKAGRSSWKCRFLSLSHIHLIHFVRWSGLIHRMNFWKDPDSL